VTVVGVERSGGGGGGGRGRGRGGGGGGGAGGGGGGNKGGGGLGGAAGRKKNPCSLLVLDPSMSPHELEEALRERSNGWQRLVKRGIQTFKATAYQIVYCPPGMASAAEREAGKSIDEVEHIQT
jgi:hypothetical protein